MAKPIKVNTGLLLQYSQRLSSLNSRLRAINRELRAVCLNPRIVSQAGHDSQIFLLIKPNLLSDYANQVSRCCDFLNSSATQIAKTENSLNTLESLARRLPHIYHPFFPQTFGAETLSDIVERSKGLKAYNDLAKTVTTISGDNANLILDDEGLLSMIKNLDDVAMLAYATHANDEEKIEYYSRKVLVSVGVDALGGGFEAEMYVNLGINVTENAIEGLKYYDGVSNIGEFGVATCKYTGRVVVWSLLETGGNKGYSIVEGVGGLVGYDINKQYEALGYTPDFYGTADATRDLAKEALGNHYEGTDFWQGTKNMVGFSLAWWGECLGLKNNDSSGSGGFGGGGGGGRF